ncbi:response regulator transcription factor [Bacillus solitudinis]|uniref:response regulator transcription factor n=1 Tax=Bacillus solitudinis TaxID=2014074 RepID=UPI000C240179|nr:response regulator [Bacillus solitudinis]
MIKVMVVDDDKLVRKGLISAMPWKDFDMEVICEANNGEKALEILETTDIDLLLTDISMAVMSGLELMMIMRERFPTILVVVLTLHQNFDYIQKALRLGAIDYISKVELNQDCFDEILARIHQRTLAAQKSSKRAIAAPYEEILDVDEGYVWFSERKGVELTQYELENIDSDPPLLLNSGVYLWVSSEQDKLNSISTNLRTLRNSNTTMYGVMHLTGLKGLQVNKLQQLLLAYYEQDFFYDYDPTRILIKSVDELANKQVASPQRNIAEIRETLLSFNWVHNHIILEGIALDLKALQLPTASLINELYLIVNEWNRIYFPLTSEKIVMPTHFSSWIEVEKWLYRMKTLLHNAVVKPHLSEEVKMCIYRSILLINQELASPLSAKYIADKVNMSRSYFSQCFKDMFEMTFNEYVRHVRVEKAKEYLSFTDKQILWIAENTGYADHKYFSRLFRQSTGVLPSEYRQKHRKVEK